ncbi:hypothetical protein FFF34_005030 [Inquilinus sp. KBS0705]|nr:hypothetical protein FFF34_005030 [Inquilinus sp. KBS0705]
MKNERPLIRRTFLQERFEVLIRKQMDGSATFKDLIELDEIVNRDPKLKGIILDEMQEASHPPQGDKPQDIIPQTNQAKTKSIIGRIKSFLNRLFIVDAKTELKACIN